MKKPLFILQIAIPKPIYGHFDYLPPVNFNVNQLQPGMRLQVPFGRKNTCIGMLLAIADKSSIEFNKLKPAYKVIDKQAILSKTDLHLLQWASRYYHYPIGEVITTALPTFLNKGHSDKIPLLQGWKLTTAGLAQSLEQLPKNAHRQREILTLLQKYPQGLSQISIIDQLSSQIIATLRTLERKSWVMPQSMNYIPSNDSKLPRSLPLKLNTAQKQVVNQVSSQLDTFYPCLLDGVTGSGKTEVYLQIVQTLLEKNKQALILVPEINLTPQIIDRFKRRFAMPIGVWHSKLTDKERLHTWILARDGVISIIIGTRSAIWIPLARPGIFIVDEEHDPSYKQQDHFRYSARDMAVVRAQRAKIPVLLGSATPSLDTLFNANQQRYHHFILPKRAGSAVQPSFHIVDMRHHIYKKESLSEPLKTAIRQCLIDHEQALLFINRRGYAPLLMCYNCGWVAFCEHCDARLIYHENTQILSCHHCGNSRPLDTQCPHCQSPRLELIGQGTERIEERLQKEFPVARILRIDSDSTRKKYAMVQALEKIHQGKVDILVGTQMLAKGHHFPKVTLVGIINIDGGLYGVDFREPERMAQLLVQVAGRAGRVEKPGKVIVQTYHPDHPLLTRLIRYGYPAFAETAIKERQKALLPPYSRLALMRAESIEPKLAIAFLEKFKTHLQQYQYEQVKLWGPVASPMEKRDKWYRAQLLLQSNQRDKLHQLLAQSLANLSTTSKVRWSLDIDPQDLL
ncbi:MAG: primosomal protein N' [Thiomargarita sp.]|nr:primosomal protein N' [Thiomargarita sp.]